MPEEQTPLKVKYDDNKQAIAELREHQWYIGTVAQFEKVRRACQAGLPRSLDEVESMTIGEFLQQVIPHTESITIGGTNRNGTKITTNLDDILT